MKLHVMVEYVGHVIHAGGSVTHRHVEIELTDEQKKKLKLDQDEHYGVFSIETEKES